MRPVQFSRPNIFAILLTFGVLLTGCYNRFRIPNTRLPDIQTYTNLKYYAINADTTVFCMWELTNSMFISDTLIAHPVKKETKKAYNFVSTTDKKQMKYLKNVVLVYVKSGTTASFSTTGDAHIAFAEITKIEVFEKDTRKIVKRTLQGIGLTICVASVITFLVLARD